MRNFPETEPRRYLIAIGSPECPNMEGYAKLDQVEEDIRQVVDIFQDQGYVRVLDEVIDLRTSSQTIKEAVSRWFSSDNRRPSDHVIIYYGGHGDDGRRFKHHYLFTSDSTEYPINTTAIKTKDFIECFFVGNKQYAPQNILLILDTCYAGEGARQSSENWNEFKDVNSEGSGFWMISSANAKTEAGDGAFVKALKASLQCNDQRFGQEEFLPIERLVEKINELLEEGQQASFNVLEGTREARFIGNPWFNSRLLERFPDADRLLRLLEEIELERLNEAYRKCYPECDSQPFPRSPKALLSALIHLPNGVGERLPKFIDSLMQDGSIPTERSLVLQEWGSSDRPSGTSTQPAVQTEFCLMVHVCESQFRDRYDVLAVLGQDACNYTTLPVAEDENATFTDKQLPKVVADLVHTCDNRSVPLKKLTIQCFLPKNLLNVAIEQEALVIKGSAQITATVCKSFVVRSLERQLERQKPGRKPDFAGGDWQNQWSKLIANLNASCRDVLVFYQGDDDPFYENLQDETIVGCSFVGFANPLKHEELFDEIFLIGLPIAIWLRPDHAAADPCALLEAVLTGSTIEALPQSLNQKRKRARLIRASEQDKMVQHVALMWDNPSQPFPRSAYPET
jgi:vWA-MoxR associated protein C-terminal domain/Caspase domain/vWA-MoxR associated protein middle region (VMAP-M) 1